MPDDSHVETAVVVILLSLYWLAWEVWSAPHLTESRLRRSPEAKATLENRVKSGP